MPSTSFMGATIRRREDPRLITGAAIYVDDINLPRMAYLAIVRSPHAHARIIDLDLKRARQHPKVLAAVSGADVEHIHAAKSEADRDPDEPVGEEGGGDRPLLAREIARFAGEGVAAIVATDLAAAEDAIELVDIEYERLPPFLDIESPDGTAADFPDAKSGPGGLPIGSEREFAAGDVDAAFREAHVVVSQRMVNQRLAPLPMETRGVVASYDSGRRQLTVYASTQCAHFVRNDLADILRLPQTSVRVIAPEVGGGFGCKIGKYPEDVLASYFSMLLNRPIKWIESRSENFLSTVHGRSQIGTLELAADRSGRVTGLRLDLLVDTGAYDAGWLGTTTSGMITGCYAITNVQSRSRSILTHKTPLGAYRGAGRPEASFFIERGMDIMARKLNMEPAELRRQNYIPPDSFPYDAPDWPVFDSGDYRVALEAALERVGYASLVEEREKARSDGRLYGVGIASYVEVTGFGWETSTLTIESDGTATVYTGISPHGQGQETTFAQIVADVCGLIPSEVKVTYGDTAMGYGQGTMGSRGTSVGGTAVHRAAVELREKMRTIAAEKLEAASQDLELDSGKWHVKGSPDRFETVKAVVEAAFSPGDLPEGMEPGLRATSSFDPKEVTAPFGTHVAVVEIDGDTGEIELRRFLTVDDCGTIISPQLVEGQLHGGVLQGVSQALYEEVVYDNQGQPLTGTLVSYAIPTIGEAAMPEVTHTETPSKRNELGVKGVGEAGSIGSTPAVVNAVLDALSPLGITHLDMPLTPYKIWEALQTAVPRITEKVAI